MAISSLPTVTDHERVSQENGSTFPSLFLDILSTRNQGDETNMTGTMGGFSFNSCMAGHLSLHNGPSKAVDDSDSTRRS